MMGVAAPNGWTQQLQVDDGLILNGTMTPGGVLTAPSPNTAAAAGLSSTASSTAARAAMERPAAPQEGGQAQLRCPRCDSANTKFCYYNNYSLSQPRHFCKACKRYWTRGGTLRNVPVGGGCRKNKRIKNKPSTTNAATASSSTSSTDTSLPSHFPFLPNPSAAATAAPPSASSDLGLLFYSLANQPSDVSTSLPSNLHTYDLHRQLVGALGQRFPSGATGDFYFPAALDLIKSSTTTGHLPLQTEPAAAAPPPPLEHSSSLFGATSTAASLFASTLKLQRQAQQQQQHKAVLPIYGAPDDDLRPYNGLYAAVSGGDLPLLRDIKLEADANQPGMMGSSRNALEEWPVPPGEPPLQETIASEYTSLYWNMGSTAAYSSVWPDAASSIAPLI